MGLPDYYAMQEEWRLRPPTNRLVAAYLGYEASEPAGPDDGSIDDLLEFARGMGMNLVRE